MYLNIIHEDIPSIKSEVLGKGAKKIMYSNARDIVESNESDNGEAKNDFHHMEGDGTSCW